MYHINQKFLDEVANIDVGDMDAWGARLLNIIEEHETTNDSARQEEEQEEA